MYNFPIFIQKIKKDCKTNNLLLFLNLFKYSNFLFKSIKRNSLLNF